MANSTASEIHKPAHKNTETNQQNNREQTLNLFKEILEILIGVCAAASIYFHGVPTNESPL